MCLFGSNGSLDDVNVIFGICLGSIAKDELNVRLVMGSLLRDLVFAPAVLGEVRSPLLVRAPLLVPSGLKISIHPCKVRGLSSPMYR